MTNLYFTVNCYINVDATLWSVCNPIAFVSWINKALSIYLSDELRHAFDAYHGAQLRMLTLTLSLLVYISCLCSQRSDVFHIT